MGGRYFGGINWGKFAKKVLADSPLFLGWGGSVVIGYFCFLSLDNRGLRRWVQGAGEAWVFQSIYG